MFRIRGEHARNLAIAIVAAAALAALGADPSTRRWAVDFIEWVHAEGSPAIAIFIASYIVGELLLLPRSVLSIASGFLYGPVWGAAIALGCGIAGALLAFVLGRKVGHTWAMQRIHRHPRMAALERVVDRAGKKVAFLVRLAPILPFGIVNYGFGVTAIPFRDFALGTALGLLPGSLLNAYLGSRVTVVSRMGSHRSGAGLWIGVALALVSLAALAWIAHRELAHELRDPP